MTKFDQIFLLSLFVIYIGAFFVMSVLCVAGVLDWSVAAMLPMPMMFFTYFVMAVWMLAKTMRGTWK